MGLKEKQKAQRKKGEVWGYASSFTSRFSSNLPWKETLTMRYKADSLSGEGNVCDYFVDKFGAEFKSKGYADEREGGWVRRERERERGG